MHEIRSVKKRINLRRMLSAALCVLLVTAVSIFLTACSRHGAAGGGEKYKQYAGMTAEEITGSLTLEQKASQMIMVTCYDTNKRRMKNNCYGCVLSLGDVLGSDGWQKLVDGLQSAALASDAGIPFIYGQDDVHGVYGCKDAVIFPHNIGIGAADDEDLAYRIGLATADEAKLCHMIWNYAPVVAQSADPRWGRTYESYGSDLGAIKRLGTAFTRGVQDGGIIACAKHFIADGNVSYGSGEDSDVDRVIDRGDARLTDEEIRELLSVYQAEIDAGVKTIMLSHSSLNGVKMHENKEYIDILKNEMGFEGMLAGDWDSVHNTSGATYYEQVVNSVNAGIDMLMEVDSADEARDIIIKAVEKGDIPESRVDDAVTRIIRVKLDAGVFADPFFEHAETHQTETGSSEYRALAEEAVEKSLVLLKNEKETLPLKKGMSVYVTGPAADNKQAQCGGWTMAWAGPPDPEVPGVTSILEGFKQKAGEYGINVITDKAKAAEADAVLLAVGEQTYAEWLGDAENIDLCGDLGLDGNKEAIEEAKALGKPTICCIVAGRNVFIDKYVDAWDSAVMCYLPGSEGQGIADVLCGGTDFTGKLPSPWYNSAKQIGTDDAWLERGYGLKYKSE